MLVKKFVRQFVAQETVQTNIMPADSTTTPEFERAREREGEGEREDGRRRGKTKGREREADGGRKGEGGCLRCVCVLECV